jgi:hypothetical protein
VALICVGSVRGAPGATTLALVAAGSWPRPVVLVEADPAGGVIAVRYQLGRSPGLAELAAAARNHAAPDAIWNTAQSLPGGLPVVAAPESGDIVSGILTDVASALGTWCRQLDQPDVLVDCGRLTTSSPAIALVAAADAVAVTTRPTAEDLYPTAHRARALRLQVPHASVGLVLVGERPYGPAEVAAQLGVEVLGVVADDRHSAEALTGGGASRRLRRSPLVRSIAGVVDALAGRLSVPTARPAAHLAEPSKTRTVNRGSGDEVVA